MGNWFVGFRNERVQSHVSSIGPIVLSSFSDLTVISFSLTVPDLTPTIGLGWYFFIEMFDHFRAFFVGAFQIHVFIYVAPLTYVFR